jgi:hypothetical protein
MLSHDAISNLTPSPNARFYYLPVGTFPRTGPQCDISQSLKASTLPNEPPSLPYPYIYITTAVKLIRPVGVAVTHACV